MKWYEKIKEGAQGVLKEHPVSICVFLVYSILAGIKGDFGTDIGKGVLANALQFLYLFTLLMTPVLVLCESNYAYKKKTKQRQGHEETFHWKHHMLQKVYHNSGASCSILC